MVFFLTSLFGSDRLVASKNCVLKASTIVHRPLNVPLERFQDWFSLPDIPTRLVNLNP